MGHAENWIIQHKSSFILLGFLHSLTSNLALKCFVYLYSQSTLWRSKKQYWQEFWNKATYKALSNIKQQLSGHSVSVFYTKMNHRLYRALTDDHWVIADKIQSSVRLWLPWMYPLLRTKVLLCPASSQTSRFDFYLEYHKFSSEH